MKNAYIEIKSSQAIIIFYILVQNLAGKSKDDSKLTLNTIKNESIITETYLKQMIYSNVHIL